jgi:hypothetical protein
LFQPPFNYMANVYAWGPFTGRQFFFCAPFVVVKAMTCFIIRKNKTAHNKEAVHNNNLRSHERGAKSTYCVRRPAWFGLCLSSSHISLAELVVSKQCRAAPRYVVFSSTGALLGLSRGADDGVRNGYHEFFDWGPGHAMRTLSCGPWLVCCRPRWH